MNARYVAMAMDMVTIPVNFHVQESEMRNTKTFLYIGVGHVIRMLAV